jgi:hypothetical protein
MRARKLHEREVRDALLALRQRVVAGQADTQHGGLVEQVRVELDRR